MTGTLARAPKRKGTDPDSNVSGLWREFGQIRETSIHCIDHAPEDSELGTWHETYCVLQWSEIACSLGAWLQETQPALGPEAQGNFELVKNLDRRRIAAAAQRRERLRPGAGGLARPAGSAVLSDRARAGTVARIASRCFSLSAAVIAVSIMPGAMQLTVTLREATSWASALVMPIMPALAAA